MKRLYVAGNWKMNKTHSEAMEFIKQMQSIETSKSKIIIAPPSLYVDAMSHENQKSFIQLSLQNCSHHSNGAYTGELSAEMISSMKIPYCIVGHSERRQFYGETDEVIHEKLTQLLTYQITPILCIGETLAQRQAGKTIEIVTNQLNVGLRGLTNEQLKQLIIAYEPVWAIGTGVSASTEEAQEVHSALYQYFETNYSQAVADIIPLLYGGSCNEKNARDLFSQKNIWGGLIGGASLNIESFKSIIKIAEEL